MLATKILNVLDFIENKIEFTILMEFDNHIVILIFFYNKI